MDNTTFLIEIEEFFGVHGHEDIVELETWTNGGVNMFIVLHRNTEQNFYEQFKEYMENFDVDDEIEMHREDDRYRSAFTIRQSLEDFEGYFKWLQDEVFASL